jgi:hypothetical protein
VAELAQVRVEARNETLVLRCEGCGEERAVPSGCAMRAFNTHVNRFKRQHASNCEVHARLQGDYDKAGRVAAKIITKFTRKTT